MIVGSRNVQVPANTLTLPAITLNFFFLDKSSCAYPEVYVTRVIVHMPRIAHNPPHMLPYIPYYAPTLATHIGSTQDRPQYPNALRARELCYHGSIRSHD